MLKSLLEKSCLIDMIEILANHVTAAILEGSRSSVFQYGIP